MKIIDLNISNHKEDSDMVDLLKKDEMLFKVTEVRYFFPQHSIQSEDEYERLANEWFVKHGGGSHAYRDGSHFGYTQLMKVEILKNEQG